MSVEKPIFITGNQNKADYLANMLGMSLDHQKVDLDEIQSMSLDEIVTHKVKQAYDSIGKPVLVEDVALGFTALGGLPGPFIKFFIDAPNGLEKMCRMLDGFDDRSARVDTVFAYFDGKNLQLIRGGLNGTIADAPTGKNGYGFDRIFIPNGYNGRTRAQLSPAEDEATYTTMKPFAAVKEFLS